MPRAPTHYPRPRATLAPRTHGCVLAHPQPLAPSRAGLAFRARARGLALPLLLGASNLGACVEITTTTEVRTLPHPDRASVPRPARVVERTDFALAWTQTGADLDLEIVAHPRCRDVIDVPLLRETRTIRRADPALYAEYAIVALCGSVAALAFASPESFSSPLLTADGEIIRDPGPGYTAAGVFTGIAAFTLITAIRDSVRARDSVEYEDASERRDLGPAPCEPASSAPWAGRDLELVLGASHLATRSDPRGRAHFTLSADPAHDTLPPGTLLKSALRLDPDHAISIDIVVPYESTRIRPYRGKVSSAPPVASKRPDTATNDAVHPEEAGSPAPGRSTSDATPEQAATSASDGTRSGDAGSPASDGARPRDAAAAVRAAPSPDSGLVDTPLPPPEPDPPRRRRRVQERDVP